MNTKNKETKTLPIFMFLFVAIFGILLFYIIGVLIQLDEKGEDSVLPSQDDLLESNESASYFPGCDLINNSCLSSKCDQYFLCNDKKYLACEIYDCGENFGIRTKDENEKINIEKKIKQDMEKIKKMVSKCNGKIEVIESACESDKLKIKAKITTDGDCKIETFMAAYSSDQTGSKSFMSAEFSGLGDNLYAVEIGRCDNILEVIAVGEGGVSIKKIIEKTVEK
ncbi:MAG: hypothetical protein KAS78_05805 [Candidatus Pacebacteria bacterium]|nr:hypothetical protein [Candidatus Paceibacterota bacterium]